MLSDIQMEAWHLRLKPSFFDELIESL